MKTKTSLVMRISTPQDIDKLTSKTKYINIDIINPNNDVISYFIEHGEEFMYSDTCNNIDGYNYVNHDEFVKAENIIDMIYSNMPNNLTKLETSRYLYIALGKLVSFDINTDINKNELYNLSLINNIDNIWGSISSGKTNETSIYKLYYYLCRRLDIDVEYINDEIKTNKLTIDNQILYVNLFKDIPFIQASMKTKYFATYNDDYAMDKKVCYIKSKYTNYYIDKALRNIDYTKEECVWYILYKTQNIIRVDSIKPYELCTIYKDIFREYCPNYNIKINNLFLNDNNKLHFIMITYNNNHYSYNYKKKTFVKINDSDIIDNINTNKIGLYLNEYIPNISNC